MLGVSGGLEPEFALSYQRKTENLADGKDKYYTIYCQSVKDYYETTKIDKNTPLPSEFISAEDVHWVDRINTQAKIQKHIDTAISSTVNLKEDTTKETVEALYLYAWQKKLKGITIFRSGCKRMGILTTTVKEPKISVVKDLPEPLEWGTTIQLCDDLIGKKRKIMSGCGSVHVSGWFDPSDGRLLELFLSKGSSGGCNSWMVANSRMISLALRSGASFDYVIDQLKSIPTCPSYAVRQATHKDCSKGNSCPSAIANALVEMSNEVHSENFEDDDYSENNITGEKANPVEPKIIYTPRAKCPECGEPIEFREGCQSCPACQWSRCS